MEKLSTKAFYKQMDQNLMFYSMILEIEVKHLNPVHKWLKPWLEDHVHYSLVKPHLSVFLASENL